MKGARLAVRAVWMVLASAAIGAAGTWLFYKLLPIVIGWFGLGRWALIGLVVMVAAAEYRHRIGRADH